MKGLFDDLDVNSGKLGPTVAKRNERLVKLLDAVGDLQFGDFADNTIDTFGDAYEYLMTMYASSAGKSGGESVPQRRRAEDPPILDRQQLRRRRHPAAARPLLRHDDRHLHRRVEKVEGRQQDAVHRRNFSRLVDNAAIAGNGYNLSVTSYVEQEDTSEAVDIAALNAEITAIVARRQELRTAINEIVAD